MMMMIMIMIMMMMMRLMMLMMRTSSYPDLFRDCCRTTIHEKQSEWDWCSSSGR
jgi:hypothetical protein